MSSTVYSFLGKGYCVKFYNSFTSTLFFFFSNYPFSFLSFHLSLFKIAKRVLASPLYIFSVFIDGRWLGIIGQCLWSFNLPPSRCHGLSFLSILLLSQSSTQIPFNFLTFSMWNPLNWHKTLLDILSNTIFLLTWLVYMWNWVENLSMSSNERGWNGTFKSDVI